MTAYERVRRIAALQDEVDHLIESCEDGECCPCPTCEVLIDVQAMLIVARTNAGCAAYPDAEVA